MRLNHPDGMRHLKSHWDRLVFEEALRIHESTILQQLRQCPDYHHQSDRGQYLTRQLHGRKN